MKRRDFFGRLLGGFAALAVLPHLTIQKAPVSITIPFEWESYEAMDADFSLVSDRYIAPAVARLSAEIDRRIFEMVAHS